MNHRLPFFLLASCLLLAGIFVSAELVRGANTDIVITEIGAYEGSGHEWIEIYNKGEDPVELDGWIFWENDTNHGLTLVQGDDAILDAGEYAVITQNDVNFVADYPSVTSTIFDSSWGAINESGEEIGLKDADDEFVEQFTYIAAPDYSLERIDPAAQDYTDANWAEHPDSNSVGGPNYHRQEDGGDSDGSSQDTAPQIVINEIVSDPSDDEQEWIELYNSGNTQEDLSGWSLADGVGTVATLDQTLGTGQFLVIEFSSSKLNNSGDIVILADETGATIDQMSYGSWDDGDTDDNAAAPDKGESIGRSSDGVDTDIDATDFTIFTAPTKGVTNKAQSDEDTGDEDGGENNEDDESAEQEEELNETTEESSGDPIIIYNASDVVINELVSDPADGEEEFVELYNKSVHVIDLEGWWIEDGSESKTTLSGELGFAGFLAFEKPKGNLNNTGDTVILYAPDGKVIDQVTYGNWDDGNVSDNAEAPGDPWSLARVIDGQDLNNDIFDFVLTNTITKAAANIISTATETGEVIQQIVGSTDIKINEVLPNPEGSDSEDEFIELLNTGAQTIDLSGYELGDGSTKRYTISQGSLVPDGLMIVKRAQSSIALNNSGGDEVKLYGPSGTILDEIHYTGSAGENESYARRDDGSFAWTIVPTPEQPNIIEGQSSAPIVTLDVDTEVALNEPVLFDASDTTDPDGDTMIFTWDFGDDGSGEGDVVEHAYTSEGVYTVTLLVTDSTGHEQQSQVAITVKHPREFVGGYLSLDPVDEIEISEFIPNPEGSDTTEFIELWNPTADALDLSGLKLDDEEGGSRAWTIPSETIIEPNQYLVFGRQETKLALNNTSDSVRLLYPDGTILHEVAYDDVQEGASYVRDENDVWRWTSSVTAGVSNVLRDVIVKTTARTVSRGRSKYVKPTIETTLEKLRDEDVGDKVKVRGTVAVEPGILGTQYFYIVGSPGVQVYSFKKDFPKLEVGDRVTVTGEISQINGEARIKTKTKDDIVVEKHVGTPVAKPIDVVDVGEPFEGWLVEVQGEVTELKSSYMWVDDGTEEVKVYFKRGTGINRKLLQVGDLVRVTGIVSQTRSGFQILPRAQSDIVKTGVAESAVIQIEATEEESQQEVAEKYLTATAGGLTSILIGLFAKARASMLLVWAKRAGGVAARIVLRK